MVREGRYRRLRALSSECLKVRGGTPRIRSERSENHSERTESLEQSENQCLLLFEGGVGRLKIVGFIERASASVNVLLPAEAVVR